MPNTPHPHPCQPHTQSGPNLHLLPTAPPAQAMRHSRQPSEQPPDATDNKHEPYRPNRCTPRLPASHVCPIHPTNTPASPTPKAGPIYTSYLLHHLPKRCAIRDSHRNNRLKQPTTNMSPTAPTAAHHAFPRAMRAQYTPPTPLPAPHPKRAESTPHTYCTTCPSDAPFTTAIGTTA